METEKLLKALEAVEAIIKFAVETEKPSLVRWDRVLASIQRVLEEVKNEKNIL